MVVSAETSDTYIVLASTNTSACSLVVSIVIMPVETDCIVTTPTVV